VMAAGPSGDTDAIALHARRAAPAGVHVRALIVQGTADTTVAPVNAAYLARQLLLLNGFAPQDLPPAPSLPQALRSAHYREETYKTEEHYAEGNLAVQLVTIEGLGHAWSGGDAKFTHFDARKPEATRLICEFFGLI
jgi:poly(3-hydroxybutyrate) depolymerase